MAYRIPVDLFSVDTNPKTVKGQKLGFMTAVLYLAPSDLSGVQLCPMAKLAKCEAGCLNTAGRGAFNATQSARINKTRYFLEDTAAFMRHAARDIARLIQRAMFAGMVPLVRMNGTSDIRWENYPVAIDAGTSRAIAKLCGFDIPAGEYPNIFAVFPDIQFYDYTKLANRRDIPSNYDLTFSYSGAAGFMRFNEKARAAGMRIAAVFRRREDIPAEFFGMRCVDGDNSDVRHVDPQGVIVALYAKGAARKDVGGFVIDSGRRVIPLQVAQ